MFSTFGKFTFELRFSKKPEPFQLQNMSDSTRIKQFLKKGIQAKILSVDKLLQLRAEHLMGVSELKGIDKTTVAQTLEQVQTKMRPGSSKKRKEDIDEDSIMKLIEDKAGGYLDQVKKIYSI